MTSTADNSYKVDAIPTSGNKVTQQVVLTPFAFKDANMHSTKESAAAACTAHGYTGGLASANDVNNYYDSYRYGWTTDGGKIRWTQQYGKEKDSSASKVGAFCKGTLPTSSSESALNHHRFRLQ